MRCVKAMLWLVAGALSVLPAATPAQAGDPVMSLHSLQEGREAVAEPAFEGAWLIASENMRLEITRNEGGYELKLSSVNDREAIRFEVHLVRLGSTLFADIRQTNDTAFFLLCPHVFAKIRVDLDELHFDFLDENFARKALGNGRTDLAHEWMDGTLVLTAPSNELRGFVESCAFDEEAFDEHVSFSRMKELSDGAKS